MFYRIESNNSYNSIYAITYFSFLFVLFAGGQLYDNLKTNDNFIIWKSVIFHLVLGILLVLVQFYIKRKFSKLALKQPESDKLYLIFGYSGIVFLTLFAHFYAWCLDYNSKIGFFILAVYHALIAIHAHLFIIERARKYTYHYSYREELYQFNSVIFSSLLIFVIGNIPFLVHWWLHIFFAIYFIELRVVLSWRVSIEEVKYNVPEYYQRRIEYYQRIAKRETFKSVVVRL